MHTYIAGHVIFLFCFLVSATLGPASQSLCQFHSSRKEGRQGPHYLVPHPSILMKSRCTHNLDLDTQVCFSCPFFFYHRHALGKSVQKIIRQSRTLPQFPWCKENRIRPWRNRWKQASVHFPIPSLRCHLVPFMRIDSCVGGCHTLYFKSSHLSLWEHWAHHPTGCCLLRRPAFLAPGPLLNRS